MIVGVFGMIRMDAGCIDNAWMISYPRPRGVSMLVDCCVWTVSYPRPRGFDSIDMVEEVN